MALIKSSLRRSIDGVFIVDKPSGASSNAILQKIKLFYGAKKAGHTGSLDPLATGVLPICFGESTKFSQILLEADKSYQATICLGIKTATGDSEGEVLKSQSVLGITEADLQGALQQFQGTILQVPSMFSALKHKGQPLYKLARQGVEIERPAREIMIKKLTLLKYMQPVFMIEVTCSKGTYIRTLAEDIGDALGCGAHVTALRRLQAGPYTLNMAHTMETLEGLKENATTDILSVEQMNELQYLKNKYKVNHKNVSKDEETSLISLSLTLARAGYAALDPLLLSVDSAVSHWPIVCLTDEKKALAIKQGQVLVDIEAAPGNVRIYYLWNNEKTFMGIGKVSQQNQLVAKRLVKQVM